MRLKNRQVESLDDHDKAVLQSTLSIINNIMIRNNLSLRGAIVDADGVIAVDSKDIYDDLAAGKMFVRTRAKKG